MAPLRTVDGKHILQNVPYDDVYTKDAFNSNIQYIKAIRG